MLRKIFDEVFGPHGADTAIQTADDAVGRVDFYAEKFQPLPRQMPVGLIPGNAVSGMHLALT